MIKGIDMHRVVLIFCIFFRGMLFAVEPTIVSFDSRSTFEQGTPENISISGDGELRTSPQKQSLLLSNEPFVWELVRDSRGTVYASTGNQGRIYKISGTDTSMFYDSEKLAAYAMTIDDADNLLIATSPNGSIVKITPGGEAVTFYKPDAAYIWDLKISPDGSIWAATGDTARILHISSNGELVKTYAPEVQHVRSLYISDGKVYAGTSGDGRIYKVEKDRLYVLYDTMMEEVIDLFVKPDAMVYAAAMNKSVIHPFAAAVSGSENGKDESSDADLSSMKNGVLASQLSSVTTSLFQISPSGFAKDLWQGGEQPIQSIAPLHNQILVGTGEEGRCYILNTEAERTLLYEMEEAHVTALSTAYDDVLIGTSNLGRVYRLIDRPAKHAVYLSKPVDSQVSAVWGTLQWEGRGSVKHIKFYTRSGNTKEPGKAWSDWQEVGKQNNISSPESRFLQWKVELSDTAAVIEKVDISYRQSNLKPEIQTIFLYSHNTFFEHEDQDKTKGLEFPKTPGNESEKQGYRSAEWQFQDPNYDGLVFTVSYQKKNSSHLRQMVDDWALNYYSWDTRHMSDGYYRLFIKASDKLHNPVEREQTSGKYSEYFLVDNTPPQLKNISAPDSMLTFIVHDEWSRVKNVWYSLNARKWQAVYPVDTIADSKTEYFKVHLQEPESDIAIKVEDELGNVSVYPVNSK